MIGVITTDVAYYLLMMLAMAATAAAIHYFSPFYQRLTTANRSRLKSLDGFRGLLASAVLICHFDLYRQYVQTGVWDRTGHAFLDFLGSGAVSFFFMITGFLFWSRAIDGKLAAVPLLISRFRRIMPLYLFSTAIIVMIAAWKTKGKLYDTPAKVAISLGRWACGGLFGQPAINSIQTLYINAGVTWTLQYEWIFYFLLPLLAFATTQKRFIILAMLFMMMLIAAKFSGDQDVYSYFAISLSFLCGMTAAHAAKNPSFCRIAASRGFTACLLPLLAAGIAVYPINNIAARIAFLLPFFASVACGNNIYRLLDRTWALLLGHISYSIYLLHGIILFQAFHFPFAKETLRGGWSSFAFSSIALSVLVVIISALTYRYIEHPFLHAASLPVCGKVTVSIEKSPAEPIHKSSIA